MAKNRRAKLISWTPPIFGWQYRVYWTDDDTRAESWPSSGKGYSVWVKGYGNKGDDGVHWGVFVHIHDMSVNFVEDDRDLDRAIQKMERCIRRLEEGLRQLRQDERDNS